MALGDKKYADPSVVLKSITDDSGRQMEIGDEKDIGEFNDSFLSRIQEGLNYRRIYDQMMRVKAERTIKSEAN